MSTGPPLLVKVEPGARCLYHRHVASTISLVLEGELHVFEQTSAGEVHTMKPARRFLASVFAVQHVGEPRGQLGLRA